MTKILRERPKKCPKCGKRKAIDYNHFEKVWECRKVKQGCGHKWSNATKTLDNFL